MACARQDLVIMHFYKSAATLDMQSCNLIFEATANLIERVRDLDTDFNLHNICTRFLLTATLLSIASIARVLKGPFAAFLDQARGYALFEAGVNFVRSCSIQHGDFAMKAAACAEKIWTSKKVFRDPNGSINITLRVRNRLSGAPLHDAIRCWREEFIALETMKSMPGIDIGQQIFCAVGTFTDA